jgi:hypothetical protein
MKLQPNFSWQKYEGKPEDQANQFQYQLQSMHLNTSNAINTTIDDLSFWTRERPTAFTWVDNKPIYTKTIVTQNWTAGGTVNTIPTGIIGSFYLINMVCVISNGTISLLMPNLDVAVAANNISIVRNGTDIILTSGGTNYSTYSGYVTIYYTKG